MRALMKKIPVLLFTVLVAFILNGCGVKKYCFIQDNENRFLTPGTTEVKAATGSIMIKKWECVGRITVNDCTQPLELLYLGRTHPGDYIRIASRVGSRTQLLAEVTYPPDSKVIDFQDAKIELIESSDNSIVFKLIDISTTDCDKVNGVERKEIRPPKSLDFPKSMSEEKPLKWTPIQLDLNKHLTSNLTPSEVFNLINPSVWTVISASSSANLRAMNNVSLASGVAISENEILTNYHVIEKRPYVVVKKGEQFERATVISGDKSTDRCIIHVENVTLRPVPGFRKYESLTIGESVYSVGSPKGLENTLGQGIISGKRESAGLKLIQTTAQISKGSSGGGLFDRFGNLIGITTFKLSDSEGLNFAIAIDNFLE
jgi:hypothetical protein